MSAMDGGPLAPLERYLDATAVPPPADLVDRISARLLFEPPSTAPRRFLAALRALDLRGVLRALGQNATTAIRPGTRSMLLRAQATAVVLVTVASIGFGGIAGLAATRQAVDELQAWTAKRTTIPSPSSPAAQVAPSVQQSEVREPVDRAGGPGRPADPARGQAPAEECPNPADHRADGSDRLDRARCLTGVGLGPPSDDQFPGNGADKERAGAPGERGVDKRADPPDGQGAARRDNGRAEPQGGKAADARDDARPDARPRAADDRKPESGKPPKRTGTPERDRRP